jgi:hypothetical protein
MIVAYKEGSRAVCLYGFAKNERDNIAPDELEELRAVGSRWLNLSEKAIAGEVERGMLQEVKHDDEET